MSDSIDPRLQALIREAAADLARDFDPERGRALFAAKRDAAAPIVGGRIIGKGLGVPLAIAAALTIGFFTIKQVPNFTNTTQTPTPETKTYTTNPGQRAKLTLPSGAQITLAPATKLRVTGNNAELEGQAVFTVLHKNSAPFTVKSGGATVRVLGTTFSVRSYNGEKAAQVIVAEGKVSTNNVVLSGGDAASVAPSGVAVRRDVDVAAALSWTSGRLSFNETPLKDVIPDLNRWYNVDIRLATPSLETLPVTGSFPEGGPNTLAGILELILDARTVSSGRVITIYQR